MRLLHGGHAVCDGRGVGFKDLEDLLLPRRARQGQTNGNSIPVLGDEVKILRHCRVLGQDSHLPTRVPKDSLQASPTQITFLSFRCPGVNGCAEFDQPSWPEPVSVAGHTIRHFWIHDRIPEFKRAFTSLFEGAMQPELRIRAAVEALVTTAGANVDRILGQPLFLEFRVSFNPCCQSRLMNPADRARTKDHKRRCLLRFAFSRHGSPGLGGCHFRDLGTGVFLCFHGSGIEPTTGDGLKSAWLSGRQNAPLGYLACVFIVEYAGTLRLDETLCQSRAIVAHVIARWKAISQPPSETGCAESLC